MLRSTISWFPQLLHWYTSQTTYQEHKTLKYTQTQTHTHTHILTLYGCIWLALGHRHDSAYLYIFYHQTLEMVSIKCKQHHKTMHLNSFWVTVESIYWYLSISLSIGFVHTDYDTQTWLATSDDIILNRFTDIYWLGFVGFLKWAGLQAWARG